MTLQLLPSEFPYIQYEESFIFFFINGPQTAYALNKKSILIIYVFGLCKFQQ